MKYQGLPELGKETGQSGWIQVRINKALTNAQVARRPFAFMAGARSAADTLKGYIDDIPRKGKRYGLAPSEIAKLEAEATGESAISSRSPSTT